MRRDDRLAPDPHRQAPSRESPGEIHIDVYGMRAQTQTLTVRARQSRVSANPTVTIELDFCHGTPATGSSAGNRQNMRDASEAEHTHHSHIETLSHHCTDPTVATRIWYGYDYRSRHTGKWIPTRARLRDVRVVPYTRAYLDSVAPGRLLADLQRYGNFYPGCNL